jgi:hypothetical protein
LLSAGSLGIGGAGAFAREPSAGPIDAGPLMFGIVCVYQGTLRWSGGTLFGYAGRVASGGAGICANAVSVLWK